MGRVAGTRAGDGMIPAYRLTDDFADGTVDFRQWQEFGFGSVSGGEVAGAYEFTVAAEAGTGGASLFTRARHSITGDGFVVELADAGGQVTGFQTYPVEFQEDASNRIFMNISNGFIGAWEVVGGVFTDHGFTAYNPTDHRWFRLREDAGITYWEAGPNGLDWGELASAANPIGTDSVILLCQADTFLEMETPKLVVIGHVGDPGL